MDLSGGTTRRFRRFYVLTATLLLVIVLIGFSPSFFLKPLFGDPGMIVRTAQELRGEALSSPDLPLYAVVHAAFAAAWMSLFFVQALLITSGRRALHQKLGVAGLVIAGGVAASGITAVIFGIPRLINLASPDDPLGLLAEQAPFATADIGSFSSFALAVAVAVYFRRRPETHKQLMLLASLILVPPALARMWSWSGLDNAMEFWFPLSENSLALLIIAGAWFARGKVPWVLIGGFVAWVAIYSSMLALGSTDVAQAWLFGHAA